MFKNIIKESYYLFFSTYKLFKYPTSKLYTNYIHPKAKIGKYVQIDKYCKIDRDVEIGDYTYINEYTRIDANTSRIGRYCSISHNVKIGMGPHPLDCVSTSPVFYSKTRGFMKTDGYNEYKDKGYTEIAHDVLIGANAVIMAGVKLGIGSVVGTGSIVTKDVEPYSVVAGNPAKLIRKRFDEKTVKILLESEWWNKEPKELQNMLHVNKFIGIENDSKSK